MLNSYFILVDGNFDANREMHDLVEAGGDTSKVCMVGSDEVSNIFQRIQIELGIRMLNVSM